MKLRSQTIVLRWLRVPLGVAVVYLLLLAGGDGRAPATTIDPYQVTVVQTSANLAQHLTPLPDVEFSSATVGQEPEIAVNAGVRYQRVRGFGSAMTDSSAWLIEASLAPAARQALMGALFGSGGIRLDFVKVPIGASDFTHDGRPYSYDDLPPGRQDRTLAHFSIAHDRAYILPALREARALNPQTEFMATPWSPPAWMKPNRSLGNAGNRGTLRGADYGAWAEYFVRFIQAYAHAGVPIAALSAQNEPGVATLYPGLNLSAVSEASWISRDLRPALAKAKLNPRIYAGDLGWGPTTTYQRATERTPGLAGLAWHCYYGSPGVMSEFHAAEPNLDEIIDECSPGISPTPISEVVISSLRDWASTVSLWNLALDPTGGPAQPPNHGCKGCQGLATINPDTGTVSLNRSFYQLGQASEFIAPGAQRISSAHFVTYRYPGPGVNLVTSGLDDVAVRNPDGSLVLIAYDNAASPVRFAVAWRGRTFSYTLPARATVTFVWNRAGG